MIRFTEQAITAATKYGPFEVAGIVIGAFAVHRNIEATNTRLSKGINWTVTHVASGKEASAAPIADRDSAIAMALMLAGTDIDFGAEFPAGASPEERKLTAWIAHTSRTIAPTFDYSKFVTLAPELQAAI